MTKPCQTLREECDARQVSPIVILVLLTRNTVPIMNRGCNAVAFAANEVYTLDGQVIKDRSVSSLALRAPRNTPKVSTIFCTHRDNIKMFVTPRHCCAGFIIYGEYVKSGQHALSLQQDRSDRRKSRKKDKKRQKT